MTEGGRELWCSSSSSSKAQGQAQHVLQTFSTFLQDSLLAWLCQQLLVWQIQLLLPPPLPFAGESAAADPPPPI